MATWGFNFCGIASVTWNQAVEAYLGAVKHV